jgi:prepilin-type N-terminal cleavage/methylation domain-containing protein
MAVNRYSAGFTLIEVLVAIVVAAMFLDVLARALGASWSASRRPMEQVSALAIARAVAANAGAPALPPEGRIDRFDYETTVGSFAVEPRRSNLAPAPERSGAAAKPPAARESVAKGELQRVTVTVTAPSGRRLVFETIRVDGGRN